MSYLNADIVRNAEAKAQQSSDADRLRRLKAMKAGIWLYFGLLVFEGGLRKWLLPGFSTPLLIIRDPVAFWLLAMAWKYRVVRGNFYLYSIILVGILGTFTALFWGHENIVVAFFGARVFLLHLPLIFVIGRVFDQSDVEKLGRIIIWISIPMTVLVVMQFYSPQSAFVNRGVGGDIEGAGFGGALGYFRPPGTFSFTNGNTLFYSLMASFLFYFWLVPASISRVILYIASGALMAAIPISISRALFFQVIVSSIFFSIAAFMNPKIRSRMLPAIISLFIGVLVLGKTSFYGKAIEVFSARYEDANAVEGGLTGVIGERFIGKLLSAVTDAFQIPLSGFGLGISSNVGLMLLPDKQSAGVSDFEWERLITELGPLLGLAVVFLRIGLTTKIATTSFSYLKQRKVLPWMLLSFGSLTVLQAQWAQPTSLGFCTLIGGLMVASFRDLEKAHYN